MRSPSLAPVNDTQREYRRLCQLGGGVRGGPARGKVLELLKHSGKSLNAIAYREMAEHFSSFPEANPWHICFSVGLCWGHLAKLDVDFTGAVVGLLANWNDDDLVAARSFSLERGPDPIEQSLRGAYMLFERVILPTELPSDLQQLSRAQDRWLSPILRGQDRPRYIGSWNATAMFMSALFAQPAVASTHLAPPPILPPGGPIFEGLKILHQAGILSRAPAGNALDDEAFEPGALYENNALFAELIRGSSGWSLLDVHSGVYMLGTRHPHSNHWI
jgi:hypothetical protein